MLLIQERRGRGELIQVQKTLAEIRCDGFSFGIELSLVEK